MAAWWKSMHTLFRKPDLSYRETYLRKDINQAIAVVFAIAILVPAYVYVDYLSLHTKITGYAIVRLTFFVASIWMVSLLRKTHDVNFTDYAILIWGIALIAVISFISLRQNKLTLEHTYTNHLWILGFYLVIPNRLFFKLIPALLLSSIDIFVLVNHLQLQVPNTAYLNFFTNATTIIVLNIIGFLVARRFDEQRYHEYLIQKTLSAGQEQLKLIATTDSLTGILNRRGFFDLAEIEFDRYKRYETDFSFAIIDVDKLKMINDQHGHPAGDLALQTLIEFINQGKRSSDIFGRLAGDEFGLVMPNTKIDDAYHMINRIHNYAASHEIITSENAQIVVNFSAGITDAQTKDKTIDDIYRRADHTLLSAKNKGRNIIEKA